MIIQDLTKKQNKTTNYIRSAKEQEFRKKQKQKKKQKQLKIEEEGEKPEMSSREIVWKMI